MVVKKRLSIKEAKKYISLIDFSTIIDKMVKYDTWLREDAEKSCQLYRNFLYLKRKYSEKGVKVPPSKDIDEFWHYHILDTNKYIEDCNIIYGYYLHHHPTYYGKEGLAKLERLKASFEELQKVHYREFGYFIQATRENRNKLINYFLHRKSRSKPI
jgi:hypothetical protein